MTVEELLVKKNIVFTYSGHDYLIRCLNPEHEDRSPSCRVDKLSGVFHCFSCSFKGNLFTLFSIPRDVVSEKVNRLLKKIDDIRLATNGLEIPPGSLAFAREYRGISAETFKAFDTFLNTTNFEGRIAFPIRDVTGRIAAFHTRTLRGSPKDKYRNYPEGVPLFPFPQVITPLEGSIILVEGMFDMLNLYDKGLTNVACTFGTNTLTEKRIVQNLQNYKLQGVQKIYVLFDGDNAGRAASKKLTETIKSNTVFDTEEIFLDEQDPGALTLDEVRNLKSIMYGEVK